MNTGNGNPPGGMGVLAGRPVARHLDPDTVATLDALASV
jgi:hypothetical protein